MVRANQQEVPSQRAEVRVNHAVYIREDRDPGRDSVGKRVIHADVNGGTAQHGREGGGLAPADRGNADPEHGSTRIR